MFKNPLNIFRLIPIGIVLIGFGLLVGSYLSFRSTQAFLRTAVTTEGKVIGYERRNNSEGEISYFPVITFNTSEGEQIEFTSSSGGGSRGYKIGATVPLRYDPALPYNAAIDTPADLWIATGVLGGLGVGFVAVGGFVFWIFRPGGKMDTAALTPSESGDADFDDDFDDDFDFEEDEPATYADPAPQVKII